MLYFKDYLCWMIRWPYCILTYIGFEAYLVGGCVRDLLLNKIPKDFDVITTAKLKEVFFFPLFLVLFTSYIRYD